MISKKKTKQKKKQMCAMCCGGLIYYGFKFHAPTIPVIEYQYSVVLKMCMGSSFSRCVLCGYKSHSGWILAIMESTGYNQSII